MSKGVINILKTYFSSKFNKLPLHLGRWKIENCNVKLNTKIDLANEDHCGPCGHYALTKIDVYEKSKK